MTLRPETFDRFARAALQFCNLVEEPPQTGDRAAFVWAMRSSLAEILASGYRLPEVESTRDEPPNSPNLEEWKAQFGKVQMQIGELPGGPETLLAVSDDLADTWRDLKTGLDSLATGSRWEDVSWEWRFGLQTHWGKHAENALIALHDA